VRPSTWLELLPSLLLRSSWLARSSGMVESAAGSPAGEVTKVSELRRHSSETGEPITGSWKPRELMGANWVVSACCSAGPWAVISSVSLSSCSPSPSSNCSDLRMSSAGEGGRCARSLLFTPVEHRRGSSGLGGRKLCSPIVICRKELPPTLWWPRRGEPRRPGSWATSGTMATSWGSRNPWEGRGDSRGVATCSSSSCSTTPSTCFSCSSMWPTSSSTCSGVRSTERGLSLGSWKSGWMSSTSTPSTSSKSSSAPPNSSTYSPNSSLGAEEVWRVCRKRRSGVRVTVSCWLE